MRDLGTYTMSSLHVFSQNFNRNSALLELILASSVKEFDIIFMQELSWQIIRNAPSGADTKGTPVNIVPIHPSILGTPSSILRPSE